MCCSSKVLHSWTLWTLNTKLKHYSVVIIRQKVAATSLELEIRLHAHQVANFFSALEKANTPCAHARGLCCHLRLSLFSKSSPLNKNKKFSMIIISSSTQDNTHVHTYMYAFVDGIKLSLSLLYIYTQCKMYYFLIVTNLCVIFHNFI